jgi:hypothetical protein
MGTGRNTENFLVHEFTNGRLSLGVSEGAHWKWLRLQYTQFSPVVAEICFV